MWWRWDCRAVPNCSNLTSNEDGSMIRSRVGRNLSLGLCLALTLHTLAFAQEVEAPPQEEALRVFLDCKAITCLIDMDFFRTEIDFVNWVRDREDSDVYLLITGQVTGGGGWAHDLFFIGMGPFESRSDTLRHFSSADDTQDARREGLAQMIRIGLVRYVGETPGAQSLDIRYRRPEGEAGERRAGMPTAVTGAEDDPWNYWVFSTSLSGSLNGESSYSYSYYRGTFSANRITEDWKIRLSWSGYLRETEFEYEDYTSSTFTRTWSGSGLVVKSLTDHWSAGIRTTLNYSTRSNYDLAVRAAPVLEYNIFPYAESTRRQLTFQYSVRANHFDYMEETIFGKMKEDRLSESLTVSLNLTQPWGSAYLSAAGEHFLDDFEQHHLTLYGGFSFRLFRGLRFNVSADYSRIRDDINISAALLTEEELLLRLKQLRTNFRYGTSIGLSYTFGSIYNNVVNPRIDGGGGMFIMF